MTIRSFAPLLAVIAGACLAASGPAVATDTAAHALAEKFANGAEKEEAKRRAAEAKRKADEAKRRAAAEEAEMLERARAEADERKVAADKARAEAEAADARREEEERQEKARLLAEEQRIAREKFIAEQLRAEEDRRIAEEKKVAEEKRAEEERLAAEKRAEDERRLAEDKRQAEEARLAAEREAEENRLAAEKLAEEKRIAEEKQRADEARISAERRAAEERRLAEEQRAAEEKRIAEQKRQQEEQRLADEKRRSDEERFAAEKRAEEELRIAEQKRADDERRAEEEHRQLLAAEREAEHRNLTDKLLKLESERNARKALAEKEPMGLGAKPLAVAPPPTHPSVAAPAPFSTRVTVLLVMEPGTNGIRRYGKKTADPVLCSGPTCWVSTGAASSAAVMTRGQALGPGNTLGRRAADCNQHLACTFRGLDLKTASALVQPIDLRVMRHDRRQPLALEADRTCRISSGALVCDKVYATRTWRAWVVPEALAAEAGAAVLEAALARGLAFKPYTAPGMPL
jgi:colicin import membrane protein